MKIIAWNVNSLRTIIKKDNFDKLITNENPDILCLSETKLSNKDIDKYFKENYINYKYRFWHNSKIKLGYASTAILMKKKPKQIIYGLEYDNENIDNEGRVITVIINNNTCLIHIYNINAGEGLKRLEYKIEIWSKALKLYILNLKKKFKNIILCGDINVAHHEIDIENPKKNLKSAGFTIEERNDFTLFLDECNLIDIYRYLYPKTVNYTYYSYRFKSRKNKKNGWRLDYFLVSKSLIKKIKDCIILDYDDSDHLPIKLII